MLFDGINLLGFVVAIAFIAVAWDAITHRDEIFREPLTANRRSRIMRLVIFGLLPASIILHEAGHALVVKLIGHDILSVGFYFVYGYVEWNAFGASAMDIAWVAVSGTIVNVIIGVVCLWVFWFRPQRPAVNFTIALFAVIQGANALIFYPVLDFMGGMVGDWSSIYSSDTPVFSAVVGVIHAGILIGGVLLWRDKRIQRGYAERTGQVVTSPEERVRRSDLGMTIGRAANQAIDGWTHPVQLVADGQAGGIQAVLRWESEAFHRALVVHAPSLASSEPHVEIHAAIRSNDPGIPPYQRPLQRIDGEPNVAELAEYIRSALNVVDTWDGRSTPSLN